MLVFLESKHADLLESIRSTGELTDEIKTKLDSALDAFAEVFQPSKAAE